MEKIGVEFVKDNKAQDQSSREGLEKKAASTKKPTLCYHPLDRVYDKSGVKYCRACEKYIEIK